ncbi:MAG: glycoside hydrolase family 38 C-terminal domain-containing protein [Promethearchaeota archaeon]
MTSKDETVLVPHTHWDREWYVPFELFRFRLVDVVDHLLDVLDRRSRFVFTFDGQAVALLDYLAVRPEQEGRLRRHVASGRLLVGPWFVQCSPWLQTGEGLVRNLEFGAEVARRLGGEPMRVGHVPDQFVHPAQLPQLLLNFGIAAASFSRGVGNQEDEEGLKTEFAWRSPDGSEVLALHLAAGYGQNAGLPRDPLAALDVLAFTKGTLNRLPRASNLFLMFNGSDHRGADEVVVDAVDAWNSEPELVEEEGTLRLGTLQDFVDAYLERAPDWRERGGVHEGELQGSRRAVALKSVYSTRMPLKRLNFAAHDLLERRAEPLSVLVWLLAGDPAPAGFLRLAWRRLLKCNAHDSIWGSCPDDVAGEVEARLRSAKLVADELAFRQLQRLALDVALRTGASGLGPARVAAQRAAGGPRPHQLLVAFNPHPWPLRAALRVKIPLEVEKVDGGRWVLVPVGGESPGLAGADAGGSSPKPASALPCHVREYEPGLAERRLVRNYVPSHGPLPKKFAELRSFVELPPVGHASFKLQHLAITGAGWSPGTLRHGPDWAENDAVRVEVAANGSFRLVDKRNSVTYEGLNVLEDVADAGCTYEFKGVEGDSALTTETVEGSLRVRAFPGKVELRARLPWRLPERLAGVTRSSRLVEFPVDLVASVSAGNDPRVEVTASLVNRAGDHRLRVLFPTGTGASRVQAGGHFGVVARPVPLPEGRGWASPPVGTNPFHEFFSVGDPSAGRGLLVGARHLSEYEAVEARHGGESRVTLALTLFRSVGRWAWHLNRKPPVPVPGAQLLGRKMTFHYCVVPHDGDLVRSGALNRAKEFYSPPACVAARDPFGWESRVNSAPRAVPARFSLLRVDPPLVQVTSVRPLPGEGEGFRVHVHNPLGERVDATVTFGLPAASVELARLDGTPMTSGSCRAGEKPHLAWPARPPVRDGGVAPLQPPDPDPRVASLSLPPAKIACLLVRVAVGDQQAGVAVPVRRFLHRP